MRVTFFHLRDRIFRLKAETTRGGPSRSAVRGEARPREAALRRSRPSSLGKCWDFSGITWKSGVCTVFASSQGNRLAAWSRYCQYPLRDGCA